MLDLMRRKKRLKLVLWVVIIGLALGMLLFFVPAARMGDTELVSSAATVDGDPISMKEFWQTYRRVIDNYSAQGRNRLDPETIRALGLGRQALDSIISIRVMNQTAKRMGLSIAPEELRQAVETYPAFQDKGSFIGVARYKQLLTANNLTVAEFEENLHNGS